MEYAVRQGLSPSPTIAQVSDSSSIRSMTAWSIQGLVTKGEHRKGVSASRGLFDDGRHSAAADGGALGLGGGLEVGLERAHPLLECGVPRGEDAYGEQARIAGSAHRDRGHRDTG